MPGEGRGLSWKLTQEVTKTEGLAMSLATPESVQKLQAALHDKAKKSPDFRFYALYDKVYRKDVLTFAFECSKANAGAAGVDDHVRGHRSIWRRAMVGRIDARAEKSNISATPRAAGIHTEARGEAATFRSEEHTSELQSLRHL